MILTTGHHSDDGRLTRHTEMLRLHGVTVELVALEARSRWQRFLAAPVFCLVQLWRYRPRCAVFPDPELFVLGPLASRILRIRPVIDIHEDYTAVAATRAWIPSVLRPGIQSLMALAEKVGRRLSAEVIVAAPSLCRSSNDRLVSNLPPPRYFTPRRDFDPRLVYVGDLSEARGLKEMVRLAASQPDLTLELIGPAPDDTAYAVRRWAEQAGLPRDRLVMTGRLPYRDAWRRASGALAGLSLLHPTPAYSEAIPTKIWEYMASGLPVVASDLPAQADLVRRAGCGVVVSSVDDAAQVISRWRTRPDERWRFVDSGLRFYTTAQAADQSVAELLAAVGEPTPI
ncbi:MAG: hypothetical protein KatS3mg011_1071 [Acidimicrobiia bacterium]|nr:MAG: hypothetical protein KatS3mg011_1071 [Acidimicrobiia bacterium]